MTHTYDTHAYRKKTCTQSHRCGCLSCDWSILSTRWADPCMLILAGDVTWEVFTAISQKAHSRLTHLNCTPYFRDVHTYIAAFNSPPTDVPREKKEKKKRSSALKNSHRWFYTPPASVTSPNCVALLTPPTQGPVLLIWLSRCGPCWPELTARLFRF